MGFANVESTLLVFSKAEYFTFLNHFECYGGSAYLHRILNIKCRHVDAYAAHYKRLLMWRLRNNILRVGCKPLQTNRH